MLEGLRKAGWEGWSNSARRLTAILSADVAGIRAAGAR
jgi:hypothetical protein